MLNHIITIAVQLLKIYFMESEICGFFFSCVALLSLTDFLSIN